MVKTSREDCAHQSYFINPSIVSFLIIVRSSHYNESDSMGHSQFLWKGGKGNERKFHLINWTIVRPPTDSGGLGIRDQAMMNVASGDKLVWRLVTGQTTWWKRIILKN